MASPVISANPWLANEVAMLRKMVREECDYDTMAMVLNRSTEAVRKRCRVLGIAHPNAWARTWTEEERAQLLAFREGRKPFKAIAKIMGRSPDFLARRYEEASPKVIIETPPPLRRNLKRDHDMYLVACMRELRARDAFELRDKYTARCEHNIPTDVQGRVVSAIYSADRQSVVGSQAAMCAG